MTTRQWNRIIAAKAAIVAITIERHLNNSVNDAHSAFLDTLKLFRTEPVDFIRRLTERNVRYVFEHHGWDTEWFDLEYEIMQLAFELSEELSYREAV